MNTATEPKGNQTGLRKIRRWQTLRWRISACFLLLFAAGTALLVAECLWFTAKLNDVALQQTHSNIAADISEILAPVLSQDVSYAELQQEVSRIGRLNPDITIYVLNQQGQVKMRMPPTSGMKCPQVPIGKVKEFLSAPMDDFPIYNIDPRDCRSRVFSATPIMHEGEERFLYVVIEGSSTLDKARGVARENIFIAQGVTLAFFTGFGSIAVGLYVLLLFARRFERIVQVVQSYRDGALDARLQDSGRDEFGQLSGLIDEMADTIQGNISELEHRDELRRDLIANISHDLRGPATHIRIASEQLADVGDELSAEISRTLISSVSELEQMLRELFELAKLEAKETQPQFQKFSIDELYDDLALRYAQEAKEKGLTFGTQVAEDLPFVCADPALVRRALGNLLQNAIRYTPKGGAITLSAARGRSGVLVKVSDTGVGISQEELTQLFERYYRGNEKRPSVPGSTGLGLAITKRIVELHGSSIFVESEVSRGTNFWFELPLEAVLST